MTEADTGTHNSDNLFRPLEQGVVEKFDALFTAREKTLRHWLAREIRKKEQFLTRTFPNLIRTGAEHPQLAGGVLYMMGLLTEHTHGGSEAINSIARRFAERSQTTHAESLRPKLAGEHRKAEAQIKMAEVYIPPATLPGPPEHRRIFNQELERARITRELYDFKQVPVRVQYEKDGKPVDLGINSSEYSILNKNSNTGRSMVFISQSAGNVMGTESFAVEYALRTGDKVYVIGQPDGANGKMTKEFADAAVSDSNPPYFDFGRKFRTPSYEPHTRFMKAAISSIVPDHETFDLYSHSGGGLEAKNLLHDPDVSKRVNNAVFLNPAGITTQWAAFPQAFRRIVPFAELFGMLRDLPHLFRATYELDRNEIGHKPAFRFRDRVTVAFQSGTHYRQPDWDTMKVNGGKIVMYLGGRDRVTGGRSFAEFFRSRLADTSRPTPSPMAIEYDRTGHHETPFAHPEEVFTRIMSRHFPSRADRTAQKAA